MDSADPLLSYLLEMGFPQKKAEKALAATGHGSVETAMEWILSHPDDDGEESEGNTQPAGDSAPTMKLPLTEAELEEQARKLEERRVQRRAEVAEQERKDEIEREKARRVSGREILDAKEKAAQVEMMRIAEERRREKMEDKKAKEKIKALIEEDRRNRDKEREQPLSANVPSVTPTPFSTPTNSSANLDQNAKTRIQIRMFDGKPLVQSFGINEPLSAVRLYAELNRQDGEIGPFGMMTNFPKKEFTEDDMQAPLFSLGLVPSATLIATRKPSSLNY
ncbi:UBX domain-containing protein 1-like [Paramacrobiotus metropolitanus]|uniref:UBX domain-containing protein 1-like n=1 Tax=Paramacrobiotus metropolitanus TaxID=2943436 RepID=UPI0024461980|nr:UBX domain-containing protein 1-like [Paramacrobiotus metropolitanus]XP_055356902.1 UBX domain-containing protein 1-like [Paramacrobiotus metropolitanus]